MKPRLLPHLGRAGAALLAALAWAGPSRGQAPVDPAEAAPAPAYTPDQLDQLLGPIALYPDPLVALVLPAATAPGDLVSAASYGAAKGDPFDAGSQPWSESVKALAHYPEVVEWMAQNLTWVQAVGAAFATEPAEVMQSIQRLRMRARNLGTLVSTPQQQVVEEGGLIEILPADADVIYVPRYDSSVVYLEAAPEVDAGAFVTFGTPYHAGIWLNYGFDWRRQLLFVGRFSRDSQGWQRPHFFAQDVHVWPAPAHPAVFVPAAALQPGRPLARPSLLPGAPPPPRFVPDRRPDFGQRPGLNPAAPAFVQRQAFPGSVPGAVPGAPAAAALQRERELREREMREREAGERTQHPGVPPAAAAHPPASPPRPPPPPPPPANTAASQPDQSKDKR